MVVGLEELVFSVAVGFNFFVGTDGAATAGADSVVFLFLFAIL